ncbi:MAG: hypothetical protein HY721_28010 [Planctomycetes bacterium]|nr:hypothetical protein [Planctomycetota bacterium]
MIQLVTFSVAAALCLLVAYGVSGRGGLEGSAAGVLIAAVLSGASQALLSWARRARGQAIVTAMLASAVASLALMGVSILLLGLFWRAAVVPAALTALSVYLAHRFAEAAAVLRSNAVRRPASSHGLAGGPR